MAATKNPIASRVQAHKKQAKGMLTPGLRVPAPDAQSSRLPAIFTRFSVGKAKEASAKMRFIDHRRMGKMQAEISKTFSQAIPQKFQEVQKLLHINPGISREETIWNEMDKPLPIQGSVRYEEPAQSGELRAGSIIQKFSMFPKEGQSIASFKEQVRSLPPSKSVRRAAPQKPKIDRTTRLFSHVQEVTSSSKPPIEEKIERPPEQPATAKQNPLQRQTNPVSASPQQQPVVSPPSRQRPVSPPPPIQQKAEKTPQADDAPDNEAIFKTLLEAIEGKSESTQNIDEKKAEVSPPSELQKKKPAQAAQPKTPIVQRQVDISAVKTDAPSPKALPVAKPKTPIVQRQVSISAVKTDAPSPKALPVAKPKTPIVQRQVDSPSVKPVTKQVEKVAPPPQKKTPPLQTEKSAPPAKAAQVDKTETQPPSEMPLRHKIQERREAPKAVKALRPEMLKPAESKPLLAPPPRPIVSREKYTRTDAPPPPTSEPVIRRPSEPAPQVPASANLHKKGFDDFKARAEQRPLTAPPVPIRDSRQNFPLAKTPRIVQTVTRASPKQTELVKDLRTQLAQSKQKEEHREEERIAQEQMLPAPSARLTSNIPISSQKVVQREPDKDTSETEKPKQEPKLDLDQLAEDVLPYVKRILEIESERVPGSLR